MEHQEVAQLLAAAKTHFEQGRFAKACNLYEHLLEQHPPNLAEIYYQLGLTFAKRGRYAQAIEQYRKAIENGGETPEVCHSLGRAYAKLEKYDEAIAEYAKATKASPKLAQAYDDAGQAYAAKGDLDAAIGQYSKAVGEDQDLVDTRLHWAVACEKRHEYSKAFSHLLKAFEVDPSKEEVNESLRRVLRQLEQPQAALKQLQKSVTRLNQAEADFEYGKTLLELKKMESAAEHFWEAIQKRAASGTPIEREIFSGLMEAVGHLPGPDQNREIERVNQVLENVKDPHTHAFWAIELAEIGLLDEAANQLVLALRIPVDGDSYLSDFELDGKHLDAVDGHLQRIFDSSPTDTLARAKWGMTLSGIECYGQAIAHFKKVAAQAQLPEVQAAWGSALSAQEQFDEAVYHLMEAIRLGVQQCPSAEQMVDWWEDLRSALGQTSKPAELIKDLQGVVKPTAALPLIVEWGWMLGVVGQTAQAVEQITSALSRDSEFTNAYEVLRDLRDDLLKKPELIETLDEVLRKSQSPKANLEWSLTLRELKRSQDALKYFEHAEKLEPEKTGGFFFEGGKIYADNERYALAISYFKRAVETDPTFNEFSVYTAWVDAIGKLDEHEGVVAKLRQVLTSPTFDAMTVIKWDEIQSKSADHAQEAQKLCQEIERNLDGDSLYIYDACGKQLLAQRRPEEALRLARKATELRPQDGSALHSCGKVLARLSQYEEAIKNYKQALDASGSSRFNILRDLALSYLARQQHEEASKAFAEALEPTSGPQNNVSVQDRVDAYNDWAWAFSEAKQHNQSLEVLQRAVKLDRGQHWTYFRLAYTYADMMIYNRALENYEHAIRLGPKPPYEYENTYTHHNLADLWERQGQYGKAREKWAEVAKLYQEGLGDALSLRDADYCYYYGLVLSEALHDLERAEALYRAAQVLAPADARVHTSLVSLYLERKKTAGQNKKKGSDASEVKMRAQWKACDSYRAAEQILTRRLELFRDSLTLIELGELHFLMEQDEKAEPTFKEALEKASDSTRARAHKGLGEVCLRTGRYEGAIQHLKAALQPDSDDLSIKAKLAQAHFKSGALEEAETQYQRIQETSRFHLDSLIGLGQVYLEMADKLVKEQDGTGEHLYERAIDFFSEARRVSTSENCPTTFTGNLSSVCYLRGYAKIKLYEASRLVRDHRLIREALKDFEKCAPGDPDYYKAKRAIARIREREARSSPRSLMERFAPIIVMGIAVFMFFLAQYGFLRGFPVRSEQFALTKQSLATIAAAGGKEVLAEKFKQAVESLKQIEGVTFRNREQLLDSVKDSLKDVLGEKGLAELGEKGLTEVKNAVLRHAVHTEDGLDIQRIEIGYYVLLTFGALLLLIGGAYLPQLTSLKFAGLQLEKSTAEQVETTRSIGVGK